MPALTDMIKLRREVESFQRGFKSGKLTDLKPAERRSIKADLDWCVQSLDELRNQLAGLSDK
jgi:hypothetical protein